MKLLKLIFLLFFITCGRSFDKQEKEILTTILNTKQEIESLKANNKALCADKKCLFLAFWDFDGTILKGDCSEGLKEKDKEVFKGLVELGILKGYAKDYKGEEGVNAFWKKYQELEAIDKKVAYVFLPKIFEGNDESVMQNLAKEHFKETLQKYYFPSSIRILEKLKEVGVQSYIISASATFFVKGSVGTTPVSPDSIYGIEMKIENGKILPTEIPPVTYAEGKREKIQQIVNNILKEKKADKVFVLAGFGNSYHTDSAFLKYIAEQKLEAGKPISVMVNGGESPAEFKGLFKEVSFDVKR